MEKIPKFTKHQTLGSIICLHGDFIQMISEAAKRNSAYVCISVTEKDGGLLHLSQLWFNPEGALIGKHRKPKATNAKKTIWGDGDGSRMLVFETEFRNLGGLQYWEHLLPLNIAAMAAQNEQIHVSSWPIAMPQPGHLFGSEACLIVAKYYAITNQAFCLVASQIQTDEQRDRICEIEEQRNYMKNGYGFSRILGPNGQEIGNRLEHDEEDLTYAEIDLEQIIPGEFLIDTASHYSTPGFLSLTFDKSIHKSVKIVGDSKPQSMTYEEIQFSE